MATLIYAKFTRFGSHGPTVRTTLTVATRYGGHNADRILPRLTPGASGQQYGVSHTRGLPTRGMNLAALEFRDRLQGRLRFQSHSARQADATQLRLSQ